MPFGMYSNPANSGRSLKDALDALMAQDVNQNQDPLPGSDPGGLQEPLPTAQEQPIRPVQNFFDSIVPEPPAGPRAQSPALAERRPHDGEPMLPQTGNAFRGAGPEPVKEPSQFDPSPFPRFGMSGPGMAMGEFEMPEEESIGTAIYDGPKLNTEGALAGLSAASKNQFSPFGELEMRRLATRDPRTTAPGAADFWGDKLQESQARHAHLEGIQRKALEGIEGAIAGTHPAVQFGAEQEARRRAMPATITAQGQLRAAQEAADSRRYVGDAQADARETTSRFNARDTVMQAIRAIRAKTGGLQGDDDVQLRALENLYDALSEQLDGVSFAEASAME